MRNYAIIAFAVMLVQAPALAEDPAAPSDQAKPTKIKKVCRVPAAKTGSRMGTGRTCRTEEEWAAIDAANAEAANLQGSRNMGSTSNN